MKNEAIFDNTVFNYAARIQTCNIVDIAENWLFHNIYVPMAIYQEVIAFPRGYEPHADIRMSNYETRISRNSKGLQLCQSYDVFIWSIIKDIKNVDAGEAEAVAQSQKRSIGLIITDDNRCIKSLGPSYSHIRFYSTFYLIASLEVGGHLSNYLTVLSEYLKIRFPDNSIAKSARETLKDELKAAYSQYGVPLTKKEIGKKLPFKKLGFS